VINLLIGPNGQLFGWAESTWLWLDQIGILLGDIMLVVGIIGGIIAFVKRDSIRRWFTRNRFPVSGEELAEDERWDALLFTVSKADLPRWVMAQKKPQAVAFLATAQSLQTASELAEEALSGGMAALPVAQLDDPDDPSEAHEEASRLITRLRSKGCQRIGVDVTGGKTPMSMGAFMAAQEQHCDTLYVTSDFDDALNKSDMRSARIRCITKAQK